MTVQITDQITLSEALALTPRSFELAQAMGGGKTHLRVALGLLAKHPHLRSPVLPADLAERLDFGPARIAAFNGRNDPEHYIWGGD